MRNKKGKEIGKIILQAFLITGAVVIASTSPYFVPMVLPKLFKAAKYKLNNKKKEKSFRNSFYYLRRSGMINVEYLGRQLHVSLTEEGRKLAGKYCFDDLEIKKSEKWNGKWYILIFDIENKQRIKREALRGKIKELGMFQLQKSVWIYPFNFQKEVDVLRNFFGFKKNELQIIVADSIEKDSEACSFFGLNYKK